MNWAGPHSGQVKSLALKHNRNPRPFRNVETQQKRNHLQKPPIPFPASPKAAVDGQGLPEDLVTEILLWLPVASLLRCKCACKSWYALITHQKFITKHILHNKKNSNTLLLVKTRDEITENDVVSTLSYETLQVLHLQPLPLPPPFLVLGSCNGLVCLHDDYALRVVLWNPATKETKVVPKSNLPHFVPAGHKLVIDGIGFGFDAKTNDYKIISLLSLYDPPSRGKMTQSEVYSLSADSWRKVDTPPVFYISFL